MRRNRKKMIPSSIHTAKHESGADMSLILEQSLFKHRHSCHYFRLSIRCQSMELNVGRDEGGDKFCVCSCTSATAANVLWDVVNLERSPSESAGVMIESQGQDLTFSQFLSATISPAVALVSAPRTIPFFHKHPTIVVPVLVALGNGRPRFDRKSFLFK